MFDRLAGHEVDCSVGEVVVKSTIGSVVLRFR